MESEDVESQLAGLVVTPDKPADESSSSELQHPRFTKLYKNEDKVAERQRERRSEHLERQNSSRQEWLDRKRAIQQQAAKEQQDGSELPNAFAIRSKRKPAATHQTRRDLFAHTLMHSDWLVDIPGSLSNEWTLVPSPVGRRCLLVAQYGHTEVYYRNGQKAVSFSTALPGGGGNYASNQKTLTILDCICASRTITRQEKFYVLDLLWWNDHMFTDTEFTCRQFFLRSKLEEMAADCATRAAGGKQQHNFVQLPSCPCSPEAMATFMQTEFPFQLDGLLFYCNTAFYIPDQTPLVGWLKPWMLPEILGVPVPERYMKDVEYANSKAFIAEYNEKKGHMSSEELKTVKENKSPRKDGGDTDADASMKEEDADASTDVEDHADGIKAAMDSGFAVGAADADGGDI